MPIPFAAPLAQLAPASWPLPGVLALVVLAMVLCAVLGVRDLLAARQVHPVEGGDGDQADRRR